jgi:hypothetical protein
MDLLINYGTTASAGGQPVIAEIELTQATTTQYTYSNLSGYLSNPNTNRISHPNIYETSPITWNGDIVYFENNNLFSQVLIQYWNSSGSIISQGNYNWSGAGNLGSPPPTFTPPSGTVTFSVRTDVPGNLAPIILSSSTPAAVTTTFYDSYPGGNVIGTTNGTEVVGSGTTQYNLTYIENQFYRVTTDGTLDASNNGWFITEKEPIINNSIIINGTSYTIITFWNENTYIGYYGNTSTTTNRLGTLNEWSIPSNATHFSLSTSVDSSFSLDQYNFSQFQTVTVSHQESYLQIDPPTGKRIKQIALKGL